MTIAGLTIDPVFALISLLFLAYGGVRLFQEHHRANQILAEERGAPCVPQQRRPDAGTTRIETKQ